MSSGGFVPLPSLPSSSHFRCKLYFLWCVHSTPPLSQLCTNITREICLYLSQIGGLADLNKDYIRFFNCDLGVWTKPVPFSPIQIDKISSRWVIIDNLEVFACGGTLISRGKEAFPAYLRSAYLLSSYGNVAELQPMSHSRAFHGVIQWRKYILVFGGKGSACVNYLSDKLECEKYSLESAAGWDFLPAMRKGRCNFNPCWYEEAIYLCGYGSEKIEYYLPLRNCMGIADCQLPEKTACCLYVQGSWLCVHSDHYIIRYKTDSEGGIGEAERRKTKRVVQGQNSQPVLAPGLVYCLRAGKCWSFHMATGETGPEAN